MDTWRDQGEEEEAVLLVHEVSAYGVDKLRTFEWWNMFLFNRVFWDLLFSVRML